MATVERTANSPRPAHERRRPRSTAAPASLIAQGEPIGWLLGGALGFCLVMIVGLLGLVVYFGASTFWPLPLVQLTTQDGKVYLGEITREETYDPTDADLETIARGRLAAESSPEGQPPSEEQVRAAVAELRSNVTKQSQEGGFWQSVLWIAECALILVLAGGVAWFARRASTRIAAGAAAAAALILGVWGVVRLTNLPADEGGVQRYLVRTENYELTNEHFYWISELAIAQREQPEWALILEREENGRFYGFPIAFIEMQDDTEGTQVPSETASSPQAAWDEFNAHHAETRERLERIEHLKKFGLGRNSARTLEVKLEMVDARLEHGRDSEEFREATQRFAETQQWEEEQAAEINAEIAALQAKNDRFLLVMQTADGARAEIRVQDIVLAYPANQLSWSQSAGVYFSRWWEFLTADPRESNTEGGVFPAIWGTIAMTLIMAVAVVPFGVLAALYLKEYAKTGPITSAVRIAVNNLAGVPSIVFGVFGLGFFCYYVGAYIDGGPRRLGFEPAPSGRWFTWLAVLAVTGTAAFLCGVASIVGRQGEGRQRRAVLKYGSLGLWLVCLVLFVLLCIRVPFFDGFFQAQLVELNQPKFGTGGLMWASLTLALLTLPVVIVSTEEALSSVPNSMREGSYACGASKWQTIKRIVLPRAMPGIMTGTILAMARGAGEVAPLMLVGVQKLAPELPVDGVFPFVHPDRSFMHLGFHIYDVGFQSQNSEAAKSLVYTTTLLLIFIIASLNLFAVWLRGRLRRKFVNAQF